MNKDYEAMMDELFCKDGGLYQHRTLRTIFDQGSYEWDQTSLDEKIIILKVIVDNFDLSLITLLYNARYSDRLYIQNSVGPSLAIVLSAVLKNSCQDQSN